MPSDKTFWVYILASRSGVLYVGVTGNIVRRVHQHRLKNVPGFTSKYNVNRLVWLEPHDSAAAAIAREKQIKSCRRSKKIALIEAMNPRWDDLAPKLGQPTFGQLFQRAGAEIPRPSWSDGLGMTKGQQLWRTPRNDSSSERAPQRRCHSERSEESLRSFPSR